MSSYIGAAVYMTVWVTYAFTQIGVVQECTVPEWDLPFKMFTMLGVMFLFGYFAGRGKS
jgi:hypothetical protein